MTKSVMIEIDESTKDIMLELEENIMQSIHANFISMINQSLNEQVNQIEQINESIEDEMEEVREEINSATKPVATMARDVEDTLRSVVMLDKQFKAQMEVLQSLQNGLLETTQKELETLFTQFKQQNNELFQKSLEQFKQKHVQVEIKSNQLWRTVTKVR